MSESTSKITLSIEDILDEAVDLTGDRVSHADHIRLRFSGDEVMFDFYTVETGTTHPKVRRLHRVALPLEVVREMAQHLLDVAPPKKTADVILPDESRANAGIWDAIDVLFTAWDARGEAENDIDDQWLDNLRAGWDERLRDMYDSDAGE